MIAKPLVKAIVIAIIFLFIGVAGAAAVFVYIPDPGSAPAIYDDFNWSSTANGFWHVNPLGGRAIIKDSLLHLTGATIELDRRLQTDPHETIILAKMRGYLFRRMSIGIGVYHAGTVGAEIDDDGVKCGRGTDFGWRVDIVKGWKTPPIGKWFYVAVDVINPYPNPADIPDNANLLKPITLRCSLWDANGKLIATDDASNPVPNTHYISLDEVYIRTWDSKNDYELDWIYAGPPSGNPAQHFLQSPT